jgi:hypothetical protein
VARTIDGGRPKFGAVVVVDGGDDGRDDGRDDGADERLTSPLLSTMGGVGTGIVAVERIAAAPYRPPVRVNVALVSKLFANIV